MSIFFANLGYLFGLLCLGPKNQFFGQIVEMIGKSLAPLQTPSRRILWNLTGHLDISARIKWRAVWPLLAKLPTSKNHVLDAGCAWGDWALELGSRRSSWKIHGIDKSEDYVRESDKRRRLLGLPNVKFQFADFLLFSPKCPFDVILAIASSHYLAEEGKGPQLFSKYRQWLKPGGTLILLGPRALSEIKLNGLLSTPNWHGHFKMQELHDLCKSASLKPLSCQPVAGYPWVVRKQMQQSKSLVLRLLSKVLSPLLAVLPPAWFTSQSSLYWLLQAEAQ